MLTHNNTFVEDDKHAKGSHDERKREQNEGQSGMLTHNDTFVDDDEYAKGSHNKPERKQLENKGPLPLPQSVQYLPHSIQN